MLDECLHVANLLQDRLIGPVPEEVQDLPPEELHTSGWLGDVNSNVYEQGRVLQSLSETLKDIYARVKGNE